MEGIGFPHPLLRDSGFQNTMNYTLNELMVVAAAREIKDGEVVFVGMRLPLISFVVAKKTHAPNAIGFLKWGDPLDAVAGADLYHGRSAEH